MMDLWRRIISDIQNFRAKSFVGDVLSIAGARYVGLALGAIFTAVIARFLGPEGYGTYRLVFATVMTVGILSRATSSVKKTLVTRFPEREAAGDHVEAREIKRLLVGTAILVGFATTGIALVFSVIVAPTVYGSIFFGLFVVASFNLLFNNLMLIPNGFLHARANMRRYAGFLLTSQLLKRVLPLLFVLAGWSTLGAVIGNGVVAPLLILLFGAYMIRDELKLDLIPSREIVRSGIGEHGKFTGLLTIGNIVAELFNTIPILILGALASAQEVGFLTIALFGSRIPKMLGSSIATNLAPRLPRTKVSDPDKFVRHVKISAIYSTVIMGGISVLGAIGTPFVVPFVLGEAYAPVVPVAILLFVRPIAQGVGAVLGPMFRATDKIHYSLPTNAIIYALALVIGVPIIQRQGALGAAFVLVAGTVVSNIVLSLISYFKILPEVSSVSEDE